MSEAQSVSKTPEITPELTAFQQTILTVLAEEARYGLAIKRELEAYYDTDVNHGRLYPNLDDLVAEDLVEKSERDKRTNEYALTDAGYEALLADIEWTVSKLNTNDERQADLEELLARVE
ncbi:PadR family transcriptional regulator [Salinibaculum salinum]|uniref:PadR family transcriptional regulator n=1 Tax=Salinibaculum salinum TaxID=3131996 RepID=UPI0030EF877B